MAHATRAAGGVPAALRCVVINAPRGLGRQRVTEKVPPSRPSRLWKVPLIFVAEAFPARVAPSPAVPVTVALKVPSGATVPASDWFSGDCPGLLTMTLP